MISFLIPFRSEEEHRVQSAHYVNDHLEREWPEAEVIWADNGGEFNRASSRNLAAAGAHGDVFVFTDADSYVPAAQINHAIQMMEKSENGCVWLFPYDEYCSLTEDASQRFMEGARQELDCEYIFPSVSHPEAAVGGCVIVSRKAFETVGGYDERFIGWGEEDRAFEMALHTLVHPQVRLVGRLFHLWHPWREEECFGQPHFGVNRILCNRYREACENPQMMRQIVDAHR